MTGSPRYLQTLVGLALAAALAVFTLAFSGATPSAAQLTDALPDTDAVAQELARTGRYLETGADTALEAAIQEANANGVAFVWIDSVAQGSDLEHFTATVAAQLDEQGAPYQTVLVLTSTAVRVESFAPNGQRIARSADKGTAAYERFGDRSVAAGLRAFVEDAFGATSSATTLPRNEGGATTSTSAPSSSSSLGNIVLLAGLAGGAFWLFRNWTRRRKTKAALAADIAADKAEIREQLRNNADRVMSLGDQVIQAGDHELTTLYEKASTTFQEVSGSLDATSDPEEIDQLDDRLDEAEWQFSVIEAKLQGLPIPPSPAQVEAAAEEAARAAQQDKADEVQSRGRPSGREQTGSPFPFPGGGLPGGFGGGGLPGGYGRRGRMNSGLGGVLGSIILGQMGRSQRSRRTQRRDGGFGGAGGGLGGGVLRPRGSRRSHGGGGSFGRRSSGGGGSF